MLKFDANGLIPAIAQDARSGEILMVAYMNHETLQKTLEIGQAVFWSRSRQEIWHKGATSGNFLRVRRIFTDCDNDTILMLVEPMGPACHTGRTSCFYKELDCEPGQTARLREAGADEPLPLAGVQQ